MWKILICDDEAMTRRGLTKMIGHCRKDMEVVGAAAQAHGVMNMELPISFSQSKKL